jgi:hypothetical protein
MGSSLAGGLEGGEWVARGLWRRYYVDSQSGAQLLRRGTDHPRQHGDAGNSDLGQYDRNFAEERRMIRPVD